MEKLKVGIIGIGKISGIYLKNLTTVFNNRVDLTSVADLVDERAREAAEEYSVPNVMSPDELIASDKVDLVLNLTVPQAHHEVCMKAVEAGKHVYVEKPLTVTREEGRALLQRAEEKGVRVGCAPDTFLGGGIQTCKKLIEDGWIGKPVAATAFMQCHGHESWHPAPEFYYKTGGGPMFDMGPYYLTALVNLIGPVRRVTASAVKTFERRTITSEPLKGKVIDVEVPTHIAGVLDFQNGAVGTIVTSFDVWAHEHSCIEIYGTEGSLLVPDPNTFGGPVKVKRSHHSDWAEIPLTHCNNENSRGIGVADMADAIANHRPHRANGALAYHVLDLMHGFHDASAEDKHYFPETSIDVPDLMPKDF